MPALLAGRVLTTTRPPLEDGWTGTATAGRRTAAGSSTSPLPPDTFTPPAQPPPLADDEVFAWRLQDGELEVDVVPLADLVDGADLVAAVNGLLPATIPRGHALLGEVLGACLADAELLSRPVAPAGRPLSVVPAWPT